MASSVMNPKEQRQSVLDSWDEHDSGTTPEKEKTPRHAVAFSIRCV